MNRKVEILGKGFYSPSLKDVAGLESVQFRFNYHTFVCNFFQRTASICGENTGKCMQVSK